jgi:cold shock CspA family protein
MAKGEAPVRGEMLWFNEVKDLGFILTEEGERLSVLGPAFAGGDRPQGRCAHAAVTFEIDHTRGERQAENVVLVPPTSPRRARLRTRGGRR